MNKILQFFVMLVFIAGCSKTSNNYKSSEVVEIDEYSTQVNINQDQNSENVSKYEEIYIYKTPYTEKTETKQETTKPLFNLETSMRCVVDVKNKDVITTIPFKYEAFELYRLNAGDNLPRYEVTGYSFYNEPADKVFRNLLSEAGIKVIATDDYYPEISSDKVMGELTNIMDSIADASDLYYTYNAKRKTLYLNRYQELAFKVPNRDLVLPVRDALQGAGIQNISVDWGDNTLVFISDKYQQLRATKLIELFEQEPQLTAYDVTVYHISPLNLEKSIDWTSLINAYGTNNIKSGEDGTIGKILVTSHIVNQKTLLALLSAQAKVYQIAQGQFSVPNKWRSRFDIWHCGNIDISEKQMAILAQTDIYGKDKINSHLGIDTKEGEISSFDVSSRLDENIIIFGIPSNSLGYAEEGETIILLTPKIVDVIKEK